MTEDLSSSPLAFVSYSRENRLQVSEYVKAIREQRLTLWMDEDELHPGTPVVRRIEQALQDSDLAIVFFSKEYLASPWAQAEMEALVRRSIEAPVFRLIVVRLDDALVPPLLGRFLWSEDPDPTEFARELDTIATHWSTEVTRREPTSDTAARTKDTEKMNLDELEEAAIEELARKAYDEVESQKRRDVYRSTFETSIPRYGALRVEIDRRHVSDETLADLSSYLNICRTHREFIRHLDQDLERVIGPDRAAYKITKDKRSKKLRETRTGLREYLDTLVRTIQRIG